MFSFLKNLLGANMQTIEHDDFLSAIKNHTHTIIDVREPAEYASGHVPGAINQPLSSFNPQTLPKNKPIILICQAGGRSGKALSLSLQAGINNIAHYSPGTGGWRARGGAIEV
jgi:rhodanese-related sulfurtransferase